VEELTAALAKSQAELDQAHRREAATAEILRVISKCTTDVQPVFDAIVTSSKSLLGAYAASVTRVVGRELVLAAYTPINPTADDELKRMYPHSLEATWPAFHVVREGVPCVVSDTETDGRVPAAMREVARRRGYRSLLIVPILSMGQAIGTVNVSRATPGAFSDKDIALLQTFADQAVIAIENARLFEAEQARTKELTERTQQLTETLAFQTATSEILNVLGRSPHQLQPVFDAIVETAGRLCSSDYTGLFRLLGGECRIAATDQAADNAYTTYLRTHPIPLTRGSSVGRAALERQAIHITDVFSDPEYTLLENQRIGRFRTLLAVPLLHNGSAIGVISLVRTKVCPFTQKQIELVTTFADQAVIAIENTRLFEAEQERTRELTERTQELTEALQYQTATSDVLGVIAASPTDIQPVLQTLVESACRLCAAYDGIILLCEGDWLQVKAHHGPISANVAKRKITRNWVNGRCVADRVQIHVQDLQAEVAEYPEGAALAQRLGARTILATPLMRESEAIGAIMIRRNEVRPFTERQIELVKTFADQAVIAIENTRLFDEVQARTRELQESLEYQTATSDVLDVISRSPSQLQPVVDEIVQTGKRLCSAERATMWRWREGKFDLLAHTISDPTLAKYLKDNPIPPDRTSLATRAVLEGRTMHVPDVQADPELGRKDQVVLGRIRTLLAVPLLCKDEPIGVLSLSKSEVEPFSDTQIALMETFADQAVIAIENTRLFEAEQESKRELTEALEQQTATAEVLKVISRSALDVQKVLDALVESAAHLCNAYDAAIIRWTAAPCAWSRIMGTYRSPPRSASTRGRLCADSSPVEPS
jgi:GAF domain-containing protein